MVIVQQLLLCLAEAAGQQGHGLDRQPWTIGVSQTVQQDIALLAIAHAADDAHKQFKMAIYVFVKNQIFKNTAKLINA